MISQALPTVNVLFQAREDWILTDKLSMWKVNGLNSGERGERERRGRRKERGIERGGEIDRDRERLKMCTDFPSQVFLFRSYISPYPSLKGFCFPSI